MSNAGKFIVFEGIDGSGKSTQLELLARRMKFLGIPHYETREPSEGEIGKLVRRVLRGEVSTDPRALAALFAADRLDHIITPREALREKLDAGITVISDRYYFSSYAYHSVDVPMDWVIELNRIAAESMRPDCTVFVDITPEDAMERIRRGRSTVELFEERDRLAKTREKYMEAFEKLRSTETVFIVDGSGSENEVSDRIWACIGELL